MLSMSEALFPPHLYATKILTKTTTQTKLRKELGRKLNYKNACYTYNSISNLLPDRLMCVKLSSEITEPQFILFIYFFETLSLTPSKVHRLKESENIWF
jgi:hypothetical protein